LYYNFASESFLSKKLYRRLHSTEVEFFFKGKVRFGRLRGNVDLEVFYLGHLKNFNTIQYKFLYNVRTSSIAR